MQTTLPATLAGERFPPAAVEIRQRYESPENLLVVFNPKNQIRFTKDLRRAYKGNSPSLGLVSKAFSHECSKSWLAVQLWNLAEFSGCKQKMSIDQIDEISDMICDSYGYLKLTELMDFFRRFKLGEYGNFYGSVDPMAITCALAKFVIARRKLIEKFDAEDRRLSARDPSESRFIRKYRERARMLRFYSHNFRSTDFSIDEFKEIWWLFNLGYERKDHGYEEY